MDTPQGTLLFFSKVFAWIDHQVQAGRNVLVHCLAGAHRAGTLGVAYCMYANNKGSTFFLCILHTVRVRIATTTVSVEPNYVLHDNCNCIIMLCTSSWWKQLSCVDVTIYSGAPAGEINLSMDLLLTYGKRCRGPMPSRFRGNPYICEALQTHSGSIWAVGRIATPFGER